MGQKSRYLIVLFLLFRLVSNAQETHDYQYFDSLTYKYYIAGDWTKLTELGQSAIDNGIDYKFLRQRLGHAAFINGNYYLSATHFEKALSFDSFDQFSLEYMYYSYMNRGKEEYSGITAAKLNPELKKSLEIMPLKLIESIEFEYNYKYAATAHRSNPQYYRAGFNSKLGYRLSLMQSFSYYNQLIEIQLPGQNPIISQSQKEYYALLKILVSANLLIKTGYHYLNTLSGTSATKGNMFLFALAPDFKRISLELNGSVLYTEQERTYQTGFQAGYVFPGRSDFYISAMVSALFLPSGSNLVYNQKAGFTLFKKVWVEGNANFGRMVNYNDYNGLYIYNSYDPMVFRSGITTFIPIGRKITLWANFSYEKKEYFESSLYNYNQFSYLGGLKWKL